MNLTPEQTRWLDQHIPHRIRAALAGTPLLVESLTRRLGVNNPPAGLVMEFHKDAAGSIAFHCCGNAVWEGRMSATRWLIDFLGVSFTRGGPGRPGNHPHDWRIDKFGVELFPESDPRIQKLAKVWLGCTKATSHPTEGSNHPPVDAVELNAAHRIMIEYLEKHLYEPAGMNLAKEVLTLHPHDPRRPAKPVPV